MNPSSMTLYYQRPHSGKKILKINGENIGSSREIVQKVYNKFKINISISTVGRYLKKHTSSILKNKKLKKIKKLHHHKTKKRHQFCIVKIIKHKK